MKACTAKHVKSQQLSMLTAERKEEFIIVANAKVENLLKFMEK